MRAVEALRSAGMTKREAERKVREARKEMLPDWTVDPRCPRCATFGTCDCFKGVPRAVVERWEHIMPLHYFGDDHLAWIEEQVSWETPPERYWYAGAPGSFRPLAQMDNRAWWEWHWSRGIYPETRRPAIPKHVRTAVIKRDGLTCQLCFEAVEPDDIHLDHIQPFSLGGRETVDNLRVTHALCNMRRGAKWHADTPTSG